MTRKNGVALLVFALLFCGSANVFPHCDSLDGPVVQAARKALDTGNIDLILVWAKPQDEKAIRDAFNEAVSMRKMNEQVKDFADRYFFETVVRIHRSGEGESYTGLKPAGTDLGPAIPAADKALQDGSVDKVKQLLSSSLQNSLQEKFQNVMSKKDYRSDDVQAGREYVETYIVFIHAVENMYLAATVTPREHESGGKGHQE